MKVRLCVAFLLGLAAVQCHAQAQINTVLAQPQAKREVAGASRGPKFLQDSGAEVMEVVKLPGGVTAYLASKDGLPVVFYGVGDGSVAFVGVMFDSKTGKNLSDAMVERSQQLMQARSGNPAKAAPQPGNGGSPTSVLGVLMSKAVAGVTEGSLSEQTAFVFFDPRCHYCHELYKNTRKLAQAGASIKWIPVNTLGDVGMPLSAEALRGGMPMIDAISTGRLKNASGISDQEKQAIASNTQLHAEIVKAFRMERATPTIVFKDVNAKMSILQDDGSNRAALAAAFGKGATR